MKNKGVGIQYNDANSTDLFDLKIQVFRDVNNRITQGLVIGSTKPQNEASILIARVGEFKTMPLLGVGLGDALLGEDLLEYRHRIREQFALDGLNVKHLDLYNLQKFSIDAEYE